MSAGKCMVVVTTLTRRGIRRLVSRPCSKPVVGQVVYEVGQTEDTQWVCAKHTGGDPMRVQAAERTRFIPFSREER